MQERRIDKIRRALIRTIALPFIRKVVKRDLSTLQKNANRRLDISNTKDLNVAYVRSDFWLNGGSSNGAMAHTIGVVEALKNLCRQVIVYTISKIEYLSQDTPQVVSYPQGRLLGINEVQEMEYSHYLAEKLYPILNAEKPSFIYQRYGRNNYTGVLLANKLNIPCVMEYNGSELWMADNWGRTIRYRKIAEEIELAVFHAADLIVGNAKALKDELVERGIQPDKIIIVPNGVDADKYTPQNSGADVRKAYGIAEDDIVVTFVGTFGPWHGASVLAQAAAKIVKMNPRVKFMFVGNGGGIHPVRNIINKSGVEKNAIYTGVVKQNITPYYLAASDILVSPQIPNPDGSPFFGSPTKLFEYMASGKAIVASNLDQMGQILAHEETALLTTPGSAEEVADCIIRLADDANLRKTLGQNAREEVVKKYTWNIHVQKILDALSKGNKQI